MAYEFGGETGTSASERLTAVDPNNPFLTAATTVRIKAGGNAADDADGNGARGVRVYGLDENFLEANELIATNGEDASSATTTTFIRVFRARVEGAGTYATVASGANTGVITLENGSGGTDLIQIAAGLGQSQHAAFTVPAGKAMYILRVGGRTSGAKPVTVRLYVRENADVVLAPFGTKRLLRSFPSVDGGFGEIYKEPLATPEKSDVWVTGEADSSTSAVDVDWDYILVDN